MNLNEIPKVIEAMLFAYGKPVDTKTLCDILDIDKDTLIKVIDKMKIDFNEQDRGIQIININNGYQLTTLEKFYPYICKLMDNRPKPSLSQAALEVLAIVAYNPDITRTEIERIRGVSSETAMNRLLEYNLLEESGRLDLPGRPLIYKTTDEFLRMFGYSSLNDLPELPKLKEEIEEQMSIESNE
jgi:segregation and condensation protein B